MLKIPMLDLDITVLYIIIILWFLLVVLNKVFYKPVGKVIDEREKKIDTENSMIEELVSNIEKKSLEVESILKKARKDSVEISEELIKKGELARAKLLNETREKTELMFKERMVKLDKELADAEVKLKSEIGTFSKKIEKIFS